MKLVVTTHLKSATQLMHIGKNVKQTEQNKARANRRHDRGEECAALCLLLDKKSGSRKAFQSEFFAIA